MVDLVLGHHPQPLPGGQRHARRCHALLLEHRRSQRAELRHRLVVQAIHEREHRVAAVGELAAVRDVGDRPVVHGLGPDQALGDGDVAREVAERKGAGLVTPLHLVRRDARRHLARALAHPLEVVKELVEVEHWPSRNAVLVSARSAPGS